MNKPETVALSTPGQTVPTSMTRWQALRMAGWVRTIDFILLFLAVLQVMGVTALAIFLTDLKPVILACTGLVCTLLFWLLLLGYRCMDFVLTLAADVNLMPDAAAKMVVQYYAGSQQRQPGAGRPSRAG